MTPLVKVGAKTSSEIMAAIELQHRTALTYGAPRQVLFRELRVGTGFGRVNQQRIDAWAMDTWPSGLMTRTAYEAKVSRSDFLVEIRNPIKRRAALLFSNLYYFVTPPGMVKPEEIPAECGLCECWAYEGQEFRLWCVVPAPWRDNPPPTWSFFAAIARRVLREEAGATAERSTEAL